ncbi:MAG: flagellar biosynthesis protein FliQ [Nitrospirota bacterium]|jgi:flagellar biosynthetic protein FliQ
MTTEFVVGLGREAIEVALMVAGPMLAVGLVVGVVVSLLQALTQVQEMTLTFVPKILSISLVLVVLMPWMAQIMIDYTVNLYSSLPELVH